VFIPTTSSILWFAVALYFYYFIGSTLEKYWGTAKFTVYYLCGVAFTMIYAFVVGLFVPGYLGVDAYYLNLSMFFAFAMLFPTPGCCCSSSSGEGQVARDNRRCVLRHRHRHGRLPGESAAGYRRHELPALLRRGSHRYDPGDKDVQFKTGNQLPQGGKEAKREMKDAPYRHKCSVCGRTDAEYPDLEFRYCSKCQGYHCFCIDHINNHVHFTE
jgi:hypothetical protein